MFNIINMFKKYKSIIIFIIFIVIAGIISIKVGFDNDWDTRNYHLYNPYAFLHNRIGYDIMPASIMTYYNPLLDIFYYVMVKYFNNYPYFVAFVFGISYGLLLFVTYKIAEIIFKTHPQRTLISIICTIMGCSALYTVLTIGRQSHDIFVAFLQLCSIYLILKYFENNNIKHIILSGFIFGCTAGFKYTCVPFCFAALIAILIFKDLFRERFKIGCIFLLSGIVGFLLTNGFWMWKLYVTFGNPIMPQFSEVFPNFWIKENVNVQLSDMQTCNMLALVNIRSIILNIKSTFCDLRYISLFIIFIINLFVWEKVKYEIMEREYGINLKYVNFILVFCIISLLFMFRVLTYMRYFCAFSALTGIIIPVYTIKFIHFISTKVNPYFKKLSFSHIIIILVSFFLIFSVDTKKAKRISRYPIKLGVYYVKNMGIPDNAVVITSSGCGSSIPFQNPKARYIYFSESRFLKHNIQILSDQGYEKLREYINEAPDKVYMISYFPLKNLLKETSLSAINGRNRVLHELSKNFNIESDDIKYCKKIYTTVNGCYLCKIDKK